MIDGLKPYPAMKDSGVPWLGEVPGHWGVLPNRAIFDEVKERDRADADMLSVTITKGVIRQQTLLEDSSKKDSSKLDRSAYKLVRPGDIAYNKMRAWQGAVGVSEYEGIVSPAYVVQRPRGGAASRYVHYLLRTPAFAKEAERWSYGITSDMWSLRPEHFKMIYSCLPPLPEQAAIVRFLDHADRRIRRYIRAKQKLIKLLEEQKQAIIHRAVTRGLDPNVRLKPSGVEWLGDVPEHWEVTRLARIVRSSNAGEVIDKGWWGRGDEVLYTCARQPLRSDYSAFPTAKRTTGRDLLLTRNGTPYVHRPVPDAIYSNVVQRVLLRGNHNREWVARALEASTRGMKGYGVSIESLNYDMWKVLLMLLPPREEQDDIIAEVDARTSTLARLIEATIREIDVVREYRTRLIADVVTGKLDVREAAARLPDEVEEPESLDEIEPDGDSDEAGTDDADAVPEEVEA